LAFGWPDAAPEFQPHTLLSANGYIEHWLMRLKFWSCLLAGLLTRWLPIAVYFRPTALLGEWVVFSSKVDRE
jgi:hypothetical protein